MKSNFPRNVFATRTEVYRSPPVFIQEDIRSHPTKDGKPIRVHRGMDAKIFKILEKDKERAAIGRWHSGSKT